MNSGTWMTAPVSRVAGLLPPDCKSCVGGRGMCTLEASHRATGQPLAAATCWEAQGSLPTVEEPTNLRHQALDS